MNLLAGSTLRRALSFGDGSSRRLCLLDLAHRGGQVVPPSTRQTSSGFPRTRLGAGQSAFFAVGLQANRFPVNRRGGQAFGYVGGWRHGQRGKGIRNESSSSAKAKKTAESIKNHSAGRDPAKSSTGVITASCKSRPRAPRKLFYKNLIPPRNPAQSLCKGLHRCEKCGYETPRWPAGLPSIYGVQRRHYIIARVGLANRGEIPSHRRGRVAQK